MSTQVAVMGDAHTRSFTKHSHTHHFEARLAISTSNGGSRRPTEDDEGLGIKVNVRATYCRDSTDSPACYRRGRRAGAGGERPQLHPRDL